MAQFISDIDILVPDGDVDYIDELDTLDRGGNCIEAEGHRPQHARRCQKQDHRP